MSQTNHSQLPDPVNSPGASEDDSVRIIQSDVQESIPRGIRVAGAWSWRLLALIAVIVLVVLAVIELRLIVIPLLVAVLIASLVLPAMNFLVRHRVPKWVAVAVTLLGTLAVVGGLMFLAINQIAADSGEVKDRSIESFNQFREWLKVSPLHLDEAQINGYFQELIDLIKKDSSAIWTGALSVGSTIGHVGAGALLTLFSLLFFLIDGPGIWAWTVRLFPKRARAAIDGAGKDGWQTLANYSRTQILVATIDAVGIGAGAFFLGVPMALPIGVLVFLGSFIPIVGAVVTGAVAIFVALVYNGPIVALIMLAIVLGVQQLEGHVLQPILMGNAVKVHPLAVVLVVTAGAMIAGIPGALFAVPLTAVINQMTRYIAAGKWRTVPDRVEAEPEIAPTP